MKERKYAISDLFFTTSDLGLMENVVKFYEQKGYDFLGHAAEGNKVILIFSKPEPPAIAQAQNDVELRRMCIERFYSPGNISLKLIDDIVNYIKTGNV